MKTNEKYQNVEISDFSGGINTELVATDIADNECFDILNFYFDKNTNLVTRYGCSLVNTSPSTFNNRVTSITYANFGSVISPIIILTSGSLVYRESDENTYIDITGTNILPNDSFWVWKQFNDLLIGCNGALSGSGYTNPVVWDGTGNIRQLLDGAVNSPSGRIIEVFANRAWIVSADSPNLIYFSKLGDAENYTVGGGSIEVNKDDGDQITGLYAHKGFLFIFKRQRIYRLITGTPNTDPNQWSISVFTSNVGCVSQFTIQAVLDDLVFLSEAGLVSLQAAEIAGDFRSVLLSKNVADLSTNINRYTRYNQFASVINQENSEYWLALPYGDSGLNNGVVWVLDYKKVNDGKIRWTRFNGLPIGVSYAGIKKDGKFRIYIGNNDKKLYKYDPDVKNDNTVAFTKKIITKAFNFNTKINRKEYESWGLNLLNKTSATSFTLTVSYKFDLNDSLVNTYNISYTETASGSLWDEVSPAQGTWYSYTNSYINITRKVISSIGRRALSIQFTITDSVLDQSYIVQNLAIFLTGITSRQVSNA